MPSIITFKANVSNFPVKRQDGWWMKSKTHHSHTYKWFQAGVRTHKLKLKGWKKIFHVNRNPKKAGVTILISEEMNFKTNTDSKR